MNRKLKIVRMGLILAVAVAATVAANVALVGYGSPRNDPVGRLTPGAATPSRSETTAAKAGSATTSTATTPAKATTPAARPTPATSATAVAPATRASTSAPTTTNGGAVDDHGGSRDGSGKGKSDSGSGSGGGNTDDD